MSYSLLVVTLSAVLVLGLSLFSINDAQAATSYELKAGNTNGACEAIGGSWGSWGPYSAACSLRTTLTLNSGDSLTIDSGVILLMWSGYDANTGDERKRDLYNSGTVDNYGAIEVGCDGSLCALTTTYNYGTINNYGTIGNSGVIANYGTMNNYGTIYSHGDSSGAINNYDGATINNHGTIEHNNAGVATINNYGTINNYSGASINYDNCCGYQYVINNYGTINNYSGASINNYNTNKYNYKNNVGVIANYGTINNYGDINNYSTINNYSGGTINNSGTIKDYCGSTFNNNGTLTGNSVNGCDPTITTVSPNPSSQALSSTKTYTANVTDTTSSPTAPNGTVSWSVAEGTFSSSSCTLVAVSPSSSSCSITYTTRSIGGQSSTVTITAAYPGDSTHVKSSGTSVVTLTTGNIETTTTVSPNPSYQVMEGQKRYFATVADTSNSPTTPTGTVSWSDNGAGGTFINYDRPADGSSCSLASVNASSSTCNITYLAPSKAGTFTFTATYSADASHSASSGASKVIITLRHTSTAVTPNPSTVVIGGKITFTGTVTDTSGFRIFPTGKLTWSDGGMGGTFTIKGTATNSCDLSWVRNTPSNTATCKIIYNPPSIATIITITASYSGDSTHLKTSGTSTMTVTLRTTETKVYPNPPSVAIGRTITFIGQVFDRDLPTKQKVFGTLEWNDGGAGGTFTVNGTATATCSLSLFSNSSSICRVTYKPPSSATVGTMIAITATYSGDSTHKASSVTSNLTVLRATSTVISPRTSSVAPGGSQLYTVTVADTTSSGTKSAPTGTVSWKASESGGSFNSISCTLVSISSSQSQCQVTHTVLRTVNTITMVATYSGDNLHFKSSGRATLAFI